VKGEDAALPDNACTLTLGLGCNLTTLSVRVREGHTRNLWKVQLHGSKFLIRERNCDGKLTPSWPRACIWIPRSWKASIHSLAAHAQKNLAEDTHACVCYNFTNISLITPKSAWHVQCISAGMLHCPAALSSRKACDRQLIKAALTAECSVLYICKFEVRYDSQARAMGASRSGRPHLRIESAVQEASTEACGAPQCTFRVIKTARYCL
jgi:hypothetical protein